MHGGGPYLSFTLKVNVVSICSTITSVHNCTARLDELDDIEHRRVIRGPIGILNPGGPLVIYCVFLFLLSFLNTQIKGWTITQWS